jgi:hypothetical protein
MADMIQDWIKDPDADLPWHFDWSDWLEDGESITASVMTASAGIVTHDPGFSTTDTVVWVSGGTVGTVYTVANRITTSQLKIDERTIRIRVQNR